MAEKKAATTSSNHESESGSLIPCPCSMMVQFEGKQSQGYALLIDTKDQTKTKILIKDEQHRPLWVLLSDCLIS